MPLDFSKIPVEKGSNPLDMLTTPIASQIPGGQEALQKFAQPGLSDASQGETPIQQGVKKLYELAHRAWHYNPTGTYPNKQDSKAWAAQMEAQEPDTWAKMKGYASGMAGAVTPLHVASAAALAPEVMAAGPLATGLSVGGNAALTAQGTGEAFDSSKSPIERILGGAGAAVGALGLGQAGMKGVRAFQAGRAAPAVPTVAPPTPPVTPQGPAGAFPHNLTTLEGIQARLSATGPQGEYVPVNPEEWAIINKLRQQSGMSEKLDNIIEQQAKHVSARAKLDKAMAPKAPEPDYAQMVADAHPGEVDALRQKVSQGGILSPYEEKLADALKKASKRQIDHWEQDVQNANRVEDIQRAQAMREAALKAGLEPSETISEGTTAKDVGGTTVKSSTKYVEPEEPEVAAGPRGAGPQPRPQTPGPQGPIQGQVVPGPTSPSTPSSAMGSPVMEGEIIPPAQGPQAQFGLPPGPDGGVPPAPAPAPVQPTPRAPLGLEPTPAEAVRLAQAGEQPPTSSKFFDRLPKLGEKAKTPKTTAKFNAAVEQATPITPEDVERFRQAQTAQRGAEFDAKGRGTVPEATPQQVDKLVKERFGGGTVAPPDETPAQAARRAEMNANARTPGPPIGVPPTVEPVGPEAAPRTGKRTQEEFDRRFQSRMDAFREPSNPVGPTPTVATRAMDISDPEMGKMFGIDVAPGTGAVRPTSEPVPTLTEPMGYGKTGGPMMEKQQAYWQDAKPAYAAGKINKGDLMVAGRASAAENAAKGAAIDARAAEAENQALLEKLQSASPEERASLIERMKKETGSTSPEMALRLGLGVAGGLTGGATDPAGSMYGEHTPATRALSALGLGSLAFIAPGAVKTIVNNPEVAEGWKESGQRGMQQAINVHNTGMLSPLSLGKKVLGDVGGLASAGAETGIANAILKALGQEPIERGSIIKALAQKAPEIAAAGKEAAISPSYQELSGTDNLVSKLTQGKMNPLSWVGRGMAGATSATKQALIEAGYSPLEAEYYTLTSRPTSTIGGGAYDMSKKSKLIQLLSPFARMGINRLERGFERSPLGLVKLAGAKSPQESAKIIARSALGTAAGGAAYELTPDDFVKKHPIAASMIGAAGSGYGIPILAAMAAKNRTKAGGLAEAGKTITKDVPGLQTLEYVKSSPLEEFPRTFLGGFTNAAKPIADITNPGEVETKTGLNPLQRLTYPALSHIPGVKGMLPKKGVNIEGLDPALLMEILK